MTYEEDDGAATHLYDPDQHPMGGQWSVNVADDDTRTMSAVEIAYQYLQGQLDSNDTYVWREGMEEWIPLGQCGELQAVIRDYHAGQPPSVRSGPASGVPASGGRGSYQPPRSAPPDPYGSEAYDDPYAADPYAGDGYNEPFAAMHHGDPFAGVAPSSQPPQSQGRRVGQRNEESSLFSLDALASLHEPAARAPVQSTPKKRKSENLDDIFSLGSGFGGGGGFAAAFAPPPIHAPPPPPPPKPVSVPPPAVSSAQAAYAPMQFAPPQRKSNLPLVVGVAAVVVLIAGAGIGFYVASSDDETGPTAQLDGKSEADTKATDNKDEADEDDKKSDGDEDKKEPDKDAQSETKTTPAGDAKPAAKTASSSSKTDSKTSSKDSSKSEEKDDKKKDDKKGGGAEFDVNAARSALGGASGAASGCGKPGGPTGKGRVSVTFSPSGRATSAVVGPPFGGTSVGNCSAAAFKRASVPPFSGGPVTVQKSFFIQ